MPDHEVVPTDGKWQYGFFAVIEDAAGQIPAAEALQKHKPVSCGRDFQDIIKKFREGPEKTRKKSLEYEYG